MKQKLQDIKWRLVCIWFLLTKRHYVFAAYNDVVDGKSQGGAFIEELPADGTEKSFCKAVTDFINTNFL